MSGRPCPEGCSCGKHRRGPRPAWVGEKIADAKRRNYQDDPSLAVRIRETNRRTWAGVELLEQHAERSSIAKTGDRDRVVRDGYVFLFRRYSHPLSRRGQVAEHRMVLFDFLGCQGVDCVHACWNCDLVLTWGGIDGICVDHIDRDPLNNEPSNLRVSCVLCNWNRDNPLADYMGFRFR